MEFYGAVTLALRLLHVLPGAARARRHEAGAIMRMHTTIYRDHELVARRESRGWRVTIADSGRRTGFHSHPFAAFAEGRAEIDALFNRGARSPIRALNGVGHRGRRLLSELRLLPAWLLPRRQNM